MRAEGPGAEGREGGGLAVVLAGGWESIQSSGHAFGVRIMTIIKTGCSQQVSGNWPAKGSVPEGVGSGPIESVL